LTLAYGNACGRALARLLIAQPFVSRLYGFLMNRRATRGKIRPFVDKYGVDLRIAEKRLEEFRSFNDFFQRRLRPEARPVEEDASAVVFPADGRHLGFAEIGKETGVFMKGQRWDVARLLRGLPDLQERFRGGSLVLSRLCPVDYHHVHFSLGGILRRRHWIGGRLFSVNPMALRRNLGYLWENKRVLLELESPLFGRVLQMPVGATNVGSIQLVPRDTGETVAKGDRLAAFAFGGSAVVTIFEAGRIELADDLLRFTAEGTELYAHYGDRMGTAK
jgi:phosphatidylserine decarboxylase